MVIGDWRTVRLGDIISVVHGWPFKGNLMTDEPGKGPVVVNIGNFEYTGGFRFEQTRRRGYNGDYPDAYRLNPGDILVIMTCQTSDGSILGIPGRVPDDGVVYLHNQRIGKVVVRDPSVIDDSFLYYVFLSPSLRRQLVSTASGTKILHTSPSRIEVCTICLPSLGEQRTIAHILGSLDDKIELNRRMSRTLEGIAQAIFKSWFIDFGPVKTKIDGREPYGLKPEIADLFPSRLMESELGPIPEGWQVVPLDQVADFLNGLALGKYPPRAERYLRVIKIAELRNGFTESSDRASADIPDEYVVKDGDVLFSWSGSLEVVIWYGGKGALNQHIFKVTSPRSPKWYHYYFIKAYLEEFRRIAADKATTMGHIQRKHLSEALCVYPTLDVMDAADKVISPLLERAGLAQMESRTLAQIRDTLLPKLISGEIRIPDAERFLEVNT